MIHDIHSTPHRPSQAAKDNPEITPYQRRVATPNLIGRVEMTKLTQPPLDREFQKWRLYE